MMEARNPSPSCPIDENAAALPPGDHLRDRTPTAGPGDLVNLHGRLMIVLGRTVTGLWMLLPPLAWGTELARTAIVRTTEEPRPVHAATSVLGRALRDRRGAWTRH